LRVSQSLFSGLLSGLETQRQISELLDELYYDGLPLRSSPREPVASMKLPKFDYYLDESDPDIVRLRRSENGSLVAAFSARGATRESIVAAAEENYRALVEAHADSLTRQQDNEEE
jgi:hypothetical protein